jgi:hypothetical protein
MSQKDTQNDSEPSFSLDKNGATVLIRGFERVRLYLNSG